MTKEYYFIWYKNSNGKIEKFITYDKKELNEFLKWLKFMKNEFCYENK